MNGSAADQVFLPKVLQQGMAQIVFEHASFGARSTYMLEAGPLTNPVPSKK